MKRIIATVIAAILVCSLLSVFASADVEKYKSKYTKVDTKLNKVTYHTPDAAAGGYGQPWYDDDEGQQKLLDGIIPTTADLEAAKKEKEEEIKDINYWAWEGWIALNKSIDAFNPGSQVNVDFEFTKEITLKELAVYSCGMEKGSVGTPTKHSVYLSDDGKNYTKTEVASCEGSGIYGEYTQEVSVITLDKPVKARYVRLVMDCSFAAWVFLSEVEFYEQKTSNYLTVADFEKETGIEIPSESEETSGETDASDVSGETDESTESEESTESGVEESKIESGNESSKPNNTSASNASQAWTPDNSTESKSNNWIIYVIIGVVVVAAAVAVCVIVSKKKK